MKKIFIAYLLLVLLGCKDNYSLTRVVNGSWGLYQVEYRGKDLLIGMQDDSNFIFSRPLYLDIKNSHLILELEIDKFIDADFKIDVIGKKKTMRIFNSTDKRFNGNYEIWIDTISQNLYRDKYKILLESDSIFMVGTKTIVKKI